ncbi:hypothetical protein COLSTE_02272 [Collinsella stercoris DSM 13279]|uniref:Uncharacterized protein n=1 Tax=Collinsella stercoris DSM 13279 TaxID=445975 RepID=B6GDT7_9ACTN|nr:hypothetical protein COLSTE_02272 [Collinsella stercoris DSM 13279]
MPPCAMCCCVPCAAMRHVPLCALCHYVRKPPFENTLIVSNHW